MLIFLRWFALGYVLMHIISCQTQIVTIPKFVDQGAPTPSFMLSELDKRQSSIRDLRAFLHTRLTGNGVNQTFRQGLLVGENETMRLETYNLFRQVINILVYRNGKALIYDPRENIVVQGKEARKVMRRLMGNHFDFKKYIKLFFGIIPRLSYLQPTASKISNDQMIYQVKAIDLETNEKVSIEIDAYTLLPKSAIFTEGTQEKYRMYWDDYQKVNKLEFAHKVEIKFVDKNEVVTVKYSDLSINQGVTPSDFNIFPQTTN